MTDPLVARDFSGWFGAIIDVVGRSWRPVLAVEAALTVPQLVTQLLFQHWSGLNLDARTDSVTIHHVGASVTLGILFAAVTLVTGAIGALAAFWLVVRQADQRPAPIGAALRFAVGGAGRLIGWSIVAAVLVAIGALFFLVPGIGLAVIILPTLTGVVAVERRGLRRCFELARGRFLPLLGRCATALLVVIVYSEIVQLIAQLAFGSDGDPGWAVTVLSTVLQLPLSVAGAGFVVVTYAELRGREIPTFGTSTLCAALPGPD